MRDARKPPPAHSGESRDPEIPEPDAALDHPVTFIPSKPFFVYILASKRNGTLYSGSTDNHGNRVWQHKTGAIKGFTWKYNVKNRVWYEVHATRESAFRRERQMKEWKRAWKIRLIEEMNPEWRDLHDTLSPAS